MSRLLLPVLVALMVPVVAALAWVSWADAETWDRTEGSVVLWGPWWRQPYVHWMTRHATWTERQVVVPATGETIVTRSTVVDGRRVIHVTTREPESPIRR